MASFKTALTYELFLIGATVLLALILMTFTTGGYLEERMHASIRSCISNRQSGGDPSSETVQKDEGMFPKPENGGVRQRRPPVFWL